MPSPDVISGNHASPYNTQLPGGYGANAAVRTWQIYQQSPSVAGQLTIQVSPTGPKQDAYQYLANVLGYSAVDFNTNDINKDGAIDLPELTHWFGKLGMYPESASKLAHQWLQGHDANLDNRINAAEHTAGVLLDINADGYLAAQNPDQASLAFYQSTAYSTPQQREHHHTALLQAPDRLRQSVAQLISTLNLSRWLRAFGVPVNSGN